MWIRNRYYCVNTLAGCRFASADHAFSDSEYKRYGGRCSDGEGAGCGKPLVAGDPVDLRRRAIASALAVATAVGIAAWGVVQVYFPAPLTGISFAAPQSQTTDTAGMFAIEVVRTSDPSKSVTVEYTTADGTALANQDYSAIRGRLRFAPSEQRKAISVPVIQDTSFTKGPRDFRVVLLNVEGQPLHIVRVAPQQMARSEAAIVEQSVRTMSVIAKDIADLVVRQRMLDVALVASRERPGEFAEYKDALTIVTGTLSRARESYVQNLRDLQTQQANTVLGAMDRVAADLRQRQFEQQAQAVTVMRKHYRELLQQQRPDMDRWAEELSSVVPKVGATAKRIPST